MAWSLVIGGVGAKTNSQCLSEFCDFFCPAAQCCKLAMSGMWQYAWWLLTDCENYPGTGSPLCALWGHYLMAQNQTVTPHCNYHTLWLRPYVAVAAHCSHHALWVLCVMIAVHHGYYSYHSSCASQLPYTMVTAWCDHCLFIPMSAQLCDRAIGCVCLKIQDMYSGHKFIYCSIPSTLLLHCELRTHVQCICLGWPLSPCLQCLIHLITCHLHLHRCQQDNLLGYTQIHLQLLHQLSWMSQSHHNKPPHHHCHCHYCCPDLLLPPYLTSWGFCRTPGLCWPVQGVASELLYLPSSHMRGWSPFLQ